MAQTETINGGSGKGTIDVSFTVGGSIYALAYVDSLVGGAQAFLDGGGNTTTVAPVGGAMAHPSHKIHAYQLTPPSVQSGVATYDIAGSGFVIDSIGGAVAINGASVGGDSVVAFADGQSVTVNSAGSNNLVIFTTGNNVFNGSTSGGGETVVGGTGNDTINTGTGSTVINAGTGLDQITLNDTVTGFYNDSAYLDTGRDTVIANGVGDYVLASVAGERIEGGAGETATSNLTVVLTQGSTGDIITGAAGYLTVGDEGGGNTITGGAGGLTFIAGAGIADTIATGANPAFLFGAAGTSLTLVAAVGNAGGIFIGGGGAETLDGSASTTALTLYGAGQAVGAGASEVLLGGSGNDTLIAGAGAESLTGGAGADILLIDSVGSAGASITITDFSGLDTLAFGGYSAGEVAAVLAGGALSNGTFVADFASSNTTLTIDGITSFAQITGHVITF